MIFNSNYGTTNRIWAAFSQSTGELKTASTSAIIDIYSGTGTAATIGTTALTALSGGTGIYYYPFDTTSRAGKWNAVFTITDAGTIYKESIDISVANDTTTGDICRGLYEKGTVKIWNVFSNSTGGEIDAGTVLIDIYPNNSDTAVYTGSMTRHGTGLYYYSAAIGTDGNYTAIMKGLSGTSIFGGIYPFSVVPGTIATGAVPSRIGTIQFDNGTSGTHAILSFTPSTAAGYNVYRSESPFSDFQFIGATTAGTFTDGTLANYTEYQYYVVGTNAAGASLPSNIVYGFVFSDRFNYAKNTYQTLQTGIANTITDLKAVVLGKHDGFKSKMPYCEIHPLKDTDENESTTGKFDMEYSANIRIYSDDATRDKEKTITSIMDVVGKVKNYLESMRGNQPYWYVSNIDEINYDKIDAETRLKYTEISWKAIRRLPRNN